MTQARAVIITGASKGIGAALALIYARPGTTLGLIGRDQQTLAAVAANCHQRGAQTQLGIFDIRDTEQLHDWLTTFDQTHATDLLIANAGITNQIGSHNETERLPDIHCVLDINLKSTIDTVHPLIERMRQRGSGQVALVSSLAAYRGMPVTPAYCASKAAVKAYGEALRGWLAPEGIRVNVICPGFVKSDMSDRFPGSRPFLITPDKAARLIKKGLARNKACIAFPFPLNMGMWFIGWLPFPIASFFLGLSGYNRPKPPSG